MCPASPSTPRGISFKSSQTMLTGSFLVMLGRSCTLTVLAVFGAYLCHVGKELARAYLCRQRKARRRNIRMSSAVRPTRVSRLAKRRQRMTSVLFKIAPPKRVSHSKHRQGMTPGLSKIGPPKRVRLLYVIVCGAYSYR